MASGAGSAGDTYPGNVLGGWGSGLNFNWEGVFGLNLPNFITIADLGLPVGLGGIPILQSGLGLPAPDAELVTLEQQDRSEEGHEFISDQTDRRDQVYVSEDVEEVALTGLSPNVTTVLWNKSDDQIWFEKMFPGVLYQAPNSTVLPTSPSTPDASLVSTEDNMGWINDVYDTVDASLGGWLPGGVPVGSSIPQQQFGGPVYTGDPGSPAVVTTDIPLPMNTSARAIAGGCAPDDPMKGMVYKKFCGTYRWVKQKRRRRRAIVTQQDLRGLAALKGVLGQGKAFEVWIATHS